MRPINRLRAIVFAVSLTSSGLMVVGGCGSQAGPSNTEAAQEQQKKRINAREEFAKQQKVQKPSR